MIIKVGASCLKQESNKHVTGGLFTDTIYSFPSRFLTTHMKDSFTYHSVI